MNKPLITVILPIYNVESYIEECLNSLLNQTIGHENWKSLWLMIVLRTTQLRS
ncbi:glycosyltransferase [Bacillus megaterium]|nr:glycosyltransferase [Priestia megaterium]